MKDNVADRIVDIIKCADSRKLVDFIPVNSINLTVCSPPYGNAIDYETHSKGNGNEHYRGNKIWNDTESYLNDMTQVFEQVRRVTNAGGYCCIIIGYEINRAEITPLPSFLITKILEQQRSLPEQERWVLREEIIWNKVTAGRNGVGNRFGVTVQNPYPTYYHANVMHEYIFVMSKGSPRIEREDARYKMAKLEMTDEMKREIANSTWHIPLDTWTLTPVPPRQVPHPAPFPEQLAWRLITLFSFPNDIVLDPFNGSGTTTKVAKSMGRHYIGVDIVPEYRDLAIKRLQEPLNLSTSLWVKAWGSREFGAKPLTEFG